MILNPKELQRFKKWYKRINCVIVLKDTKRLSLIGIHTFENTTGNSGLAKGGS